MFSNIIHHPTARLILAIAIPTAIIGFWFYAKNRAEQEVGLTTQAIKKNPINQKILVTDYELKEVDDKNQVKWQLLADTGVSDPITKDVALSNVNIDYFDGTKIKMRLSAPVGVANEGSRMVQLFEKEGKRVLAWGEDGKAKLDAAKVELIQKNQFQATGGVNILWPGVAKVSGNLAQGSLANTDLNNLKVRGNTHALIGLANAGGT